MDEPEKRMARRMNGRSIETGTVIPDERLEAEPLAERTIEEQRRFDQRGAIQTPSPRPQG